MNRDQQPRVLFYVQHLLGVGHVFRARKIATGLQSRGIAVDMVFGGPTLHGTELEADRVFFLPVIKAGAIDYSYNVDGQGRRLTPEYLAKRQKRLLDIVDDLNPDLVLLEAFPFGRRFLRDEMAALFDALNRKPKPPIVATSVRDILQEKRKRGRTEEAVATIQSSIDRVIVHSDPDLIQLGGSFPLAAEIEDRTSYSGFVVDGDVEKSPVPAEPFDVIITAGGGAFGDCLMTTALKAHEHSSLKGARWCLATGPNCPLNVRKQLEAEAPKNITVTTFLDGLSTHFAAAQVTVSQAGYNTSMDFLAARERSDLSHVFVPFDIDGQTEQIKRATLLSDHGLSVCLPQSRLTPQALASAIDDALALEKPAFTFRADGVETTALLIETWIAERKAKAE
ncbi:MAG: glycosyltransferase [Pseudomonadota bacterium]